MIDQSFDQIREADIRRLVANGVTEGRTLDYKESLPGGKDEDKKGFLADVTSFANATGGDIVLGVRERREGGKKTGIPESANGMDVSTRDAEVQRLENMLRDGVAPRIPAVRYRWVDGFDLGPVLVVRVLRSWAGPHMVTFKEHSRFYSRNASGKYILDVFELRSAFLNSGSLSDRAREFRAERLGRLAAGEALTPLMSNHLICVHVVPHASFAGAVTLDVSQMKGSDFDLKPIGSIGFRDRFNIDGLLRDASGGKGASAGYLQLFRNGLIETVDSQLMWVPGLPNNGLPSVSFANALVEFLEGTCRLRRRVEIQPPVSVLVSFLGVKEIPFMVGYYNRAFDRDSILLPDVLLVDLKADVRTPIRPALDALWQAAGLDRCSIYDAEWKDT